MPCQVDTYPSGVTNNDTNRLLIRGRNIADKATYNADIIREAILSTAKQNDPRLIVKLAEVRTIAEQNDEWTAEVEDVERKVSDAYSYNPAGVSKDIELIKKAARKNKSLVKDMLQAESYLQRRIEGKLTAANLRVVNNKQNKHRQEDLNRLMVTFAERYAKASLIKKAEWAAKIQLVLAADPNKELEPQLG